MQKWEYLYNEVEIIGKYVSRILSNGVETWNSDKKNRGSFLELHTYYSNLGKQGWELTAGFFGSESRQMHIFKRPME